MLTFDDSITQCQDLSKDYTSDTLTFIKKNLNLGYKYILSELGRSVTEKTKTTSTVALQQWYQCPKDFLFPKTVSVTIGTLKYPVETEESQQNWDLLNSFPQTTNIPQRYFVRRTFGVNTIELGLWPTPNSAGNTITVVYEASGRDLAQTAYTTGTVKVTTGSTTVDGNSVAFSTSMVGRYFQTNDANGDGLWYQIVAVNSSSQIVLDQSYEGSTFSGLTYQIAEAFSIPEEMQVLPVYYTLQNYYAIKGNDQKELKNKQLFDVGLQRAKERYANKGKSNTIRRNYYRFGYSYPAHFPISLH